MRNYPVYSEIILLIILSFLFCLDPKKGLNWLRNFLHNSSPRNPTITVSRSFPVEGNYDVIV